MVIVINNPRLDDSIGTLKYIGSLFKSRFKKEGIELRKDLSGNLPPVTLDTGQIHQVLVNIVINAIQAIDRQGGIVEISTYSVGDFVIIEVTDIQTALFRISLSGEPCDTLLYCPRRRRWLFPFGL